MLKGRRGGWERRGEVRDGGGGGEKIERGFNRKKEEGRTQILVLTLNYPCSH